MVTKASNLKKSVKKPAVKKAKMTAKATGKKKSSLPEKKVREPRPIKETMSQTQLVNYYVEEINKLFPDEEWGRKHVVEFLNLQKRTMQLSLAPGGAGMFMQPGLFKIITVHVPARKAGVMVRNPATGEMMKGKAKPASTRVRVRALSGLKKAALGDL